MENHDAIADNGMKRAAPLVLSRTNSPQVLYTMQGRAIKYSGKGTVPAGLYFSKEPGSQAAGQSMRKVVIGKRTGVKKDKQTTASPIFPSPLTERGRHEAERKVL